MQLHKLGHQDILDKQDKQLSSRKDHLWEVRFSPLDIVT